MEKKFVFPKVELPEVHRSNHNLDKSNMISFSPGTARVLWARDVLPGDHWEVSLSASIESLPMLAPLYGAFKATWAFYAEPWSNIYGWMDNNKKQSTQEIIRANLMRYSLPTIVDNRGYSSLMNQLNSSGYEIITDRLHVWTSGTTTSDSATMSVGLESVGNLVGVQPSSIWEDLGWPTGYYGQLTYDPDSFSSLSSIGTDIDYYGMGYDEDFGFLTIPLKYDLKMEYLHSVKAFAYLDVIRNYYVNNQLDYACFVGLASAESGITSGSLEVVRIAVLDYIFALLRSLSSTSYHINDGYIQTLSHWFNDLTPLTDQEDLHSDAVKFLESWERSFVLPNGGCFLTNYQMDLNRGLLATSTGNYKSSVDTTGGSFSIDTLRMQNKIQQLIDIIDLTGGRFSDWVRALWSVDLKGDVDKPIYLGSFSQTIATTDIVSPSNTEGSKAGSQTGFAAGGFNSRQITFNSDIYATIMCVFTYTPIVSYSSVFKREDLKTNFQGIYNPRMSQLGYQDVPRKVLTAQVPTEAFYSEFPSGREAVLWHVDTDGYIKEPVRVPIARNDSDYSNSLVGKQVAWAEYMSDIDESRGIFASDQSLEYWVLNRDYFYKNVQKEEFDASDNSTLTLVTQTENFNGSTYVDPAQWQNLFTDVEPNAQNFRQFCKFDVFVKRPIPKRTLGRL